MDNSYFIPTQVSVNKHTELIIRLVNICDCGVHVIVDSQQTERRKPLKSVSVNLLHIVVLKTSAEKKKRLVIDTNNKRIHSL